MVNNIEKMMRTAGIEPKYEDCCKIADKYWNNEELANEYDTFDNYMNKNCTEGDSGACFSTCKYAYDKKIYPDFTPEKQLEIIKLISKIDGVVYTFDFDGDWHIVIKNINVFNKDFIQALAQLTTELMEAGELDKNKVKEILER